MGKTYTRASDDVMGLVISVRNEYHLGLMNEGVTIDTLIVATYDKDGELEHSLKRNQYPVAAEIRVTPLADRARGLADAKLVIDEDSWRRLPDGSRKALIDHELEHLEVTRGEDGVPKKDDLGRPKLKLRPHDFEAGVFHNVIQRQGENAGEFRLMREYVFEQLPLFADLLESPMSKEAK